MAIANHPQAGVDGTDGEHPRYTTVLSNTAREVGLYEKQSSFYVQARPFSFILGSPHVILVELKALISYQDHHISFYVQAKTAQSTIHGNVFFNGPRVRLPAVWFARHAHMCVCWIAAHATQACHVQWCASCDCHLA